MKKILIFLCIAFMMFGCSKNNEKSIIKELEKEINNSDNYQLTGVLEIYRNENKYSYDVISTYEKDDNIKVELTNKNNNHKQIILKNKDAVYVLTPSLNKKFKFQSDWPYNNSQIYLLQPVITDIKNDKNLIFNETKKGYTIISKVNYSSEKNYKKQKVYFDLERKLKKIEVLDDNDIVQMKLDITNIEYNAKLTDDFFEINEENVDVNDQSSSTNESNVSNEIEEIIYPMYVPTETYLTSQDVVETTDGERVILTFAGESQFILIQENASSSNYDNYVYGDPYLVLDTVGSITDSSVSWISNGIEYSIISDTMEIDELLTVAQSIGVQPVGK